MSYFFADWYWYVLMSLRTPLFSVEEEGWECWVDWDWDWGGWGEDFEVL